MNETGNSELNYNRVARHINNEEKFLTRKLHENRQTRIILIKDMIKDGYSVIDIAKKFEVSRQRIYKILEGSNA